MKKEKIMPNNNANIQYSKEDIDSLNKKILESIMRSIFKWL